MTILKKSFSRVTIKSTLGKGNAYSAQKMKFGARKLRPLASSLSLSSRAGVTNWRDG